MKYARRTVIVGALGLVATAAVGGPPGYGERPGGGRPGGGRPGGGMRGTAPSVGDTAPDFTLKVLNSDQTVTLSERMGNGRPVVLVFGSYT